MKKKAKEYKVTYKFVDSPDAEERMQRMAELLLKASLNKLKKYQINAVSSGQLGH